MGIQIHDPLYGAFDMPDAISDLLAAPEVRRLSQVRLLNTLTPSLATLGEIRRYSHTLGVVYLASLSPFRSVERSVRDSFMAAVLLHDVGTPPFGHLAEYQLRNRFDWSHESVIGPLLWGHHVPENTAHQIFAGQTVGFRARLRQAGIDLGTVDEIVQGGHWLSPLLFGSLDFDNLDNVARMGWALGRQEGVRPAKVLASNMWLTPGGSLQLSERFRADVQAWLELRSSVYDVIVFDAPTVAAQAVLSEALARMINEGAWTNDEWSMTDEDLIRALQHNRSTKDEINREFLGQLPEHALTVQASGTLADLGFIDGRDAAIALRERLSNTLNANLLTYAFSDRGAFSKELHFVDPDTGHAWHEGSDSSSVVFYVFLRGSRRPGRERFLSAARDALRALQIDSGAVMRVTLGEEYEPQSGQLSLVDAPGRD